MNAQVYANEIVAVDLIPPAPNKAVLREVVYARMKQVDAGGATRQGVEAVVSALATVLKKAPKR